MAHRYIGDKEGFMDILFGAVIGLSIALAILYVGWQLGIREGVTEGFVDGYNEGYAEGFSDAETTDTQEFPMTNDGKFYSARAAMRDIGKVGDE